MSFFDRKEEVIDLQMTQFGKQLFADGEFKPVYYAFFDDDIIYDINYTGHTEAQNETSERIKTAARLKTQYVHYGIETEFYNVLKEIKTTPGTITSTYNPSENRVSANLRWIF